MATQTKKQTTKKKKNVSWKKYGIGIIIIEL